MDRGRHRNWAMTEPSYLQTGRPAVPENGPLVHPLNNVPRGGYHRTTHWGYRSSSSMQVPDIQQSFPSPSYDPFPHSSAAAIEYQPPQNNSIISHPNHYHRHNINSTAYGLQDSVTRSRGALKRKSPETSIAYDMGSSSSGFCETDSSRSSELSCRKPSSSVYYGRSEKPYCGNASAGEDSSRNVRRRLTLDLEDNPMRDHASRYSSHYHYPANHPPNYYGPASISNMNGGGASQNWDCGTMLHASHGGDQNAGASGLSHGNNQLVRGSGPEIGGYHSDSITGRDVALSSHNVHAPIPSARGRRSSHSMREIPPYSAGPSYHPMRHEPTSTEDRLHTHFLPSCRHSSQSARGWGNGYSSRTSGIALERFRSIAGVMDAHGRIGSEDLMMDLPTFYASSHNLFDQYRDMRLDIDDMSYEELLALGESIGNVNTGLSEDGISLSLTEEAYSLEANGINETCAICLEEYVNEAQIGTMKNCGHKYHADCIKKWLLMKNLCPICKAPARKDS